MQRIRIVYKKGEDLLYTGNLDMLKVWERTFRRAGLKLAYSQGFHPQPKIHQALPLPLGFSSRDEILDFWIDSDEPLSMVQAKLSSAIQPGVTIICYNVIPQNVPPLQNEVVASDYEITLPQSYDLDSLKSSIKKLNTCESCIRERRGKKYDLKVLIEGIGLASENPIKIQMQLSALPGATGRPEEVLNELGIPLEDVEIERTRTIFKSEG